MLLLTHELNASYLPNTEHKCRLLRPLENIMQLIFSLKIFSEIIKERGLEHVTVEDLVAEITPKGRGMFSI